MPRYTKTLFRMLNLGCITASRELDPNHFLDILVAVSGHICMDVNKEGRKNAPPPSIDNR